MKKTDEKICVQIVDLWLNRGLSQTKIADKLGIGYTTVNRTIKEYTQSGAHAPDKYVPEPENPEPDEPAFDLRSAPLPAVRQHIADLMAQREQIDTELQHIRETVEALFGNGVME